MMKDKNEFFDMAMLKRNSHFNRVVEKLMTGSRGLSFSDKSFLLACVILLIRKFESTTKNNNEENGQKGYLELAYALILQYSAVYNDFEPLSDFCIEYGFYPVVDVLDRIKSDKQISEILAVSRIRKEYKYKDFVETKQQKSLREYFFETNDKTICLSAPTSFGKSELIVEHILKNFNKSRKVAIIVPSKSLLDQTYLLIRERVKNRKCIIYDDMYDGDCEFIAVFTQERALRFICREKIYFDAIYVDEAHNIFDKTYRSIILYRFLKLSVLMNSNVKIVFISPFIQNRSNLSSINEDNVSGRCIDINIKEPRLMLFESGGKSYFYNRFLNEFYFIKKYNNYWNYIKKVEKRKNFIFLKRPLSIEMFSKSYCRERENVSSIVLNEIIYNVKKYVHDDFFEVECLQHGFVYLHAKVPDQIKDYLLSKFAVVKEITTIVANSVILEGVNLPIDCLFVLSAYGVSRSQVINLIGRVNRLKYVFHNNKNASELVDKLMPNVHFVETDVYSKKMALKNKIEELHKKFIDNVKNPLLESFDGDLDDPEIRKIRETNRLFFLNKNKNDVAQKFLVAGLDDFFDVRKIDFDKFEHFINKCKDDSAFKSRHHLDKVFIVFFENFETCAVDSEVKRLMNKEAVKYYKKFCDNRNNQLRTRIENQVRYLMWMSQSEDPVIYIGAGFGEIELYDGKGKGKLYLDLHNKTRKEIVNIAIIKQKIEDDFVSYKLSKFFQFLRDCELITDDEYALIRHGTKDESCLRLIKNGIPAHLVIRLKNDDQVKNLKIESENVIVTDNFVRYFNNLDDFNKFEIKKYIKIDSLF